MKLADHIVSGVKNMDRIISSLLLFAKSPEPSRQQCNINDLLRGILESGTDLQSPGNINIQCDFCKEEPLAQGDKELLQQVFLNFIRNAVQAMPKGGDLTLRIEKNKSPDNNTYHRHFITTTISDTGVGISSEDRESIFNPFFSTKDKGTGLGLAIAHNIVKAHIRAPSTSKARKAKAPRLSSTCRDGNERTMTDHASKKILIVDDEPEMRIAITEALKREGYQTDSAENAPDALHRLEGEAFDLVISDVKMPKMSGQELLREIKEQSPSTLVIMMTAYGTIDNAVESMKEGAFDYLLKPFSIEILAATVNRAFLSDPAPSVAPAPKDSASKQKASEAREIVTQNKTMLEMMKFAENIAYSKSTVLISGETGTGKEMVARYIHQCSPRADKPFLAVNCAALPEGLLESELFGHEKGAFTGAIARKDGKFELAHKGTTPAGRSH